MLTGDLGVSKIVTDDQRRLAFSSARARARPRRPHRRVPASRI